MMNRNRIVTLVASIGIVAAGILLFRGDAPGGQGRPGAGGEAIETPPFAPAPAAAASSRVALPAIRPGTILTGTGVSGSVVDPLGAPIAGASITVAGGPVVRTDALGGFLATDLEGPTCDLLVEAPEFAWRALQGLRLDPGRVVETKVVLDPRPQRLGRVVDAADRPVGGADVIVQFAEISRRSTQSNPFGRVQGFGESAPTREIATTSDDRGWFTFPSCAPPTSLFAVSARKEGIGSGTLKDTSLPNLTQTLIVRLRATRKLTLRLAPNDGSQPPAGVECSIRGDQYVAREKSDVSGCAVVSNFPTIENGAVTVSGPGWREESNSKRGMGREFVVAASGDVEVTVPIARVEPGPAPGVVEGRVVDLTGAPVPGAAVNATMPVPAGLEVMTDAVGRFRLTGVHPARNCRVGAARGRGPFTWSESFLLEPGATATGIAIVLGGTPDLIVDVVGVDGRRSSGIVVVVEEEGSSEAAAPRLTGVTDAAGRVQFGEVPSERLKIGVDPSSLPPGVCVDQDDAASVLMFFRRETPVVLRLRRETIFRGRLVFEDGRPVGAGSVAFRISDDTPGPVPNSGPMVRTSPLAPAPGVPQLGGGGGRKIDRYGRADERGEFTFHVCSLLTSCRVLELSRLVQAPGADPVREIFVPITAAPLTEGENVVVVKPKE